MTGVGHPHDRLLEFLEQSSTGFVLLEHAPCRTSEESYEARRTAPNGRPVIGAKAIILRAKARTGSDHFSMLVLPGDRQIESKALRQRLGFKSQRFATKDELYDASGLEPGCIPPFTIPIFGTIENLFVDEALLGHEEIGFNAARFDRSIIMRTKDHLLVSKPTDVFSFSSS